MHRSAPWFLVVVCLTGFLLARESRLGGPLGGVDRAFFDWLIANSATPAAAAGEAVPSQVTLVEIDDAIAQTPRRLPLAPLEYASFMEAVGKFEPAVVAIEPVLNWPKLPPESEDILTQQALALPKLLLGVELGNAENHALDPASLPALTNVTGNSASLPEYFEIVAAANPRLQPLAAASGAINLPGLPQAPVRDLPLLFRLRDRVLPSFALQTLMLWLQLAPSEVTIVLGDHIDLGPRLRLAINPAGRALLDSRALSEVNRLSLDDLPLIGTGQAGHRLQIAAERMRHGIIVLGRTDRDARVFRLLNGDPLSAAEIFAWAAASLDHAPATRRASVWWDAGLIAAYALVSLRLLRSGRWTGVSVVLVGSAAYGMLALVVFEAQRLWLPLALPAGLTVLICVLLWTLPPPVPAAKPTS